MPAPPALQKPSSSRGLATVAHRPGPGLLQQLVLGGVLIPHPRPVAGFSRVLAGTAAGSLGPDAIDAEVAVRALAPGESVPGLPDRAAHVIHLCLPRAPAPAAAPSPPPGWSR